VSSFTSPPSKKTYHLALFAFLDIKKYCSKFTPHRVNLYSQ